MDAWWSLRGTRSLFQELGFEQGLRFSEYGMQAVGEFQVQVWSLGFEEGVGFRKSGV